MELITPKYLTKELAEKAVGMALEAVMGQSSPLRGILKRRHCHVVILVPAIKEDLDSYHLEWPNFFITPVALYEKSVGKDEGWERPFDKIARGKAFQLWTDRNDDCASTMVHLLFSGDTVFWGGVKRRGIVVACSGFQPWFDQLVSGMVADLMVALARQAYETDKEIDENTFFLK